MTMLSPQVKSASRLAAALAVQVKKDLKDAGFVDGDVSTVAGIIVASLLSSAASGGASLEKMTHEIKA